MTYNRNAIASRIVLKVKYRADGTYDKHKARLVAKGFMERLGSDFFSTYSPMASLTTARALMAIAVNMRLPVLHSDIPQAFIKSLIDTDIWLKLPNGVKFRDGKGNAHQIVKLVRSLYGLRQSPQLFNKELNRFMHTEGFVLYSCTLLDAALSMCLRQVWKFKSLLCAKFTIFLITKIDVFALLYCLELKK